MYTPTTACRGGLTLVALFFVIVALCLIMLLVQLPPVDFSHHGYQNHKWDFVRAYMTVLNMDPNKLDDELSGSYECVDGSLLEIAFDGELWNIVPHGCDAGREFVYTGYPCDREAHVRRVRDRCLGN